MDEAEILAMTYEDWCIIERLKDVEDPDTGVTEQQYVPVVVDEIDQFPCAFSQSGLGSAGSLSVIENTDVINVTYEEQKLFLMPDIDVRKGDRVTVTQSTGQSHVLYAKKPFHYPSHIEVNLTGSEIDG